MRREKTIPDHLRCPLVRKAPAYNPTPKQFIGDYYGEPDAWLFEAAELAETNEDVMDAWRELIALTVANEEGRAGDQEVDAAERRLRALTPDQEESNMNEQGTGTETREHTRNCHCRGCEAERTDEEREFNEWQRRSDVTGEC